MAVIKKTAANTAAVSKVGTEKKVGVKAATTDKSAVKTTAAASKSTAAKKPAAKTPEKKAAPAKTAEKKAASAKTDAKASAKRSPAKKSAVTIDTICQKMAKKLPKTVSFKEKIAVDIEVWGFEDGSNANMYIEANGGKITVSPHNYDDKDFRVSVSFANAKAFVDGKMTFKELLVSPDFYAEGKIVPAIKLASIF